MKGRLSGKIRAASLDDSSDSSRNSRRAYSCWSCRSSKVRCDRGNPCSRCVRLKKECVSQRRGPGRPSVKAEDTDSTSLAEEGQVLLHGMGDLEEDCGSLGHSSYTKSADEGEDFLFEEEESLSTGGGDQCVKSMNGGRRGGGDRPAAASVTHGLMLMTAENSSSSDSSTKLSSPFFTSLLPPPATANASTLSRFCLQAPGYNMRTDGSSHGRSSSDNNVMMKVSSPALLAAPSEEGNGSDEGGEGIPPHYQGIDRERIVEAESTGPLPGQVSRSSSTSSNKSGHWNQGGGGGAEAEGAGGGGTTVGIGGKKVIDGGLQPWQMTGGLRSPLGVQHHDHCRLAAAVFGETAHRIFQQGILQHRKALAILRTWDVYSYRYGVDIACGASDSILRVLAMVVPEDSIVCPQEGVPFDQKLTIGMTEDLLDPSRMPPYVTQLKEEHHAACGYVYANGEYRLWTNEEFAYRFFTAEEANSRFQQMSILPYYIFGSMMSPKDRTVFYTRLMEYLLTRTDENQEVSVVVETVERSRETSPSLVRVRHTVLNDGQYACLALSIQKLEDKDRCKDQSPSQQPQQQQQQQVPPPVHQQSYHQSLPNNLLHPQQQQQQQQQLGHPTPCPYYQPQQQQQAYHYQMPPMAAAPYEPRLVTPPPVPPSHHHHQHPPHHQQQLQQTPSLPAASPSHHHQNPHQQQQQQQPYRQPSPHHHPQQQQHHQPTPQSESHWIQPQQFLVTNPPPAASPSSCSSSFPSPSSFSSSCSSRTFNNPLQHHHPYAGGGGGGGAILGGMLQGGSHFPEGTMAPQAMIKQHHPSLQHHQHAQQPRLWHGDDQQFFQDFATGGML